MENGLLVNRKLTAPQLEKLRSLERTGSQILFAIVGEISKDAKYSTCVLLATDSDIFTYDFGSVS
jgi:hypothetical protein